MELKKLSELKESEHSLDAFYPVTEKPKYYQYEPKEDITTFELANIIPAMLSRNNGMFVDGLEDRFKRHFVEVK
jgi:hypothetical protein